MLRDTAPHPFLVASSEAIAERAYVIYLNRGCLDGFDREDFTKDGVTVAKEIELKAALENMGAQMVKEVASKTSDAL